MRVQGATCPGTMNSLGNEAVNGDAVSINRYEYTCNHIYMGKGEADRLGSLVVGSFGGCPALPPSWQLPPAWLWPALLSFDFYLQICPGPCPVSVAPKHSR